MSIFSSWQLQFNSKCRIKNNNKEKFNLFLVISDADKISLGFFSPLVRSRWNFVLNYYPYTFWDIFSSSFYMCYERKKDRNSNTRGPKLKTNQNWLITISYKEPHVVLYLLITWNFPFCCCRPFSLSTYLLSTFLLSTFQLSTFCYQPFSLSTFLLLTFLLWAFLLSTIVLSK